MQIKLQRSHMGDLLISPLRLVPIATLQLNMVTRLVASIRRTHLEEWTPKKNELRTKFKLGGPTCFGFGAPISLGASRGIGK